MSTTNIRDKLTDIKIKLNYGNKDSLYSMLSLDQLLERLVGLHISNHSAGIKKSYMYKAFSTEDFGRTSKYIYFVYNNLSGLSSYTFSTKAPRMAIRIYNNPITCPIESIFEEEEEKATHKIFINFCLILNRKEHPWYKKLHIPDYLKGLKGFLSLNLEETDSNSKYKYIYQKEWDHR